MFFHTKKLVIFPILFINFAVSVASKNYKTIQLSKAFSNEKIEQKTNQVKLDFKYLDSIMNGIISLNSLYEEHINEALKNIEVNDNVQKTCMDHIFRARKTESYEEGETEINYNIMHNDFKIITDKPDELTNNDKFTSENRSSESELTNQNLVLYPDIGDAILIYEFVKICHYAYRKGNFDSDNFALLGEFTAKRSGLQGALFKMDFEDKTTGFKQEIIVISFRGTTINATSNYDAVRSDQHIDNLLFSCCCGRGTKKSIKGICDCYAGGKRCQKECLNNQVKERAWHYYDAIKVFQKVKSIFKNSQIWVTGHSLGGALASLIAIQNQGVPCVSFSAPGENLAASRLGVTNLYKTESVLQSYGVFLEGGNESTLHPPVYNIALNSDPIANHRTTNPNSFPVLFGYNIETKCRVGIDCVIDDTYYSPILAHRISNVERTLQEFSANEEKARFICRKESNCKDCFDWSFV